MNPPELKINQIVKPPRNITNTDYNSKIVVIGDSGVGKTNILIRFCNDQFKQTHIATIGVDFNFKIIKLGAQTMKLQVWDTAGQQRFKSITETYYKNASGVIIVFSLNNRFSFQNAEKWIINAKNKIIPQPPMVLIGNKKDIPSNEREVSEQEGKQLAEKYKINYVEVSAKTSQGVQQVFQIIGKQIKAIKDKILQQEQGKKKALLRINQIENKKGKLQCYC